MRFGRLAYGLLLLCAAPLCARDVLDRIVATVNGHAILQSDWDDEARYEILMSAGEQRPAPQDRKAVLERLVDRELVSEQASTTEFAQATAEEIDKQLEQVKSEYASNSRVSWTAALATYGLTESEVGDRIARELDQLKLLTARLRPSVQIDQSATEDYYNRRFLPALQSSGAH